MNILYHLGQWKYYLKHIKWFLQRAIRGYSDRDLWSFDWYLCKMIPRALRQLANKNIGYPHGLTSEQWEMILNKIANGFESGFRLLNFQYGTNEDAEKLQDNFDEAMCLFHKWFFHFWD